MFIGNIDLGTRPLFLAPMEDVTDIGFRRLCKRYGAAMVYTEFVAAEALVRSIKATVRKLTISDDQVQVEASIDALVNPVGNSFSEKCAAVKYSFLKEIPERIARNYYIQGPQGGVKGISLDRKLVKWEE